MKKKTIKSTLALMLAMTMVLGSSMSVHACPYCGDGTVKHPNQDYEDARESGTIGGDSGSSDSGSGTTEESLPWTDQNNYSSGNSGSGSDSGSSDSGSNDGGSSYDSGYDSGSSDNGSSYDAGWTDSSYAAPADGTATAVTGLTRKGNTVSIPGYETFRQKNKAADGRVSIYHCGIEQYTAQLKNADGTAAAFKSAGMYKDEATGKWYLNITTDADGCTVGTYKGSVNYLAKLGMSGVMINDVVAAEAAAE